MAETLLSPSNILLFGRVVEDLEVKRTSAKDPGGTRHSPFTENHDTPGEATTEDRTGPERDLETQVVDKTSNFARIYGFSYEGTYYDLPKPALFLVHGPGYAVTGTTTGKPTDTGKVTNPARAPGEPSLSGVATADFQFVDGIKAWSYDKADHTIRMDVEAGELEDVLLDMFFNGGGGPAVSGARVSGARVSGARVSGARVSGARLSGGRGDVSD
jgi:hypothetical protein